MNSNHEEHNLFQEVQSKFSIIDVAQKLGIDVQRVGRTYRAYSIAPDGGGKNAFTVYMESNSWFDFKLGIGGDITDLVAYYKFNGDIKQALIDLLPDRTKEIDYYLEQRKKFAQEVEQYHQWLLNNYQEVVGDRHIIRYLSSRGISDDYIKRIKIGLDRNNRLFIPYWDLSGKNPIYFITRRLPSIYGTENEDEPKYLKPNPKSYPFLHNSPWGLHSLARERDELFITEGQFDAMHLDQAGASVLAPNGGDFSSSWPQVLQLAKNFKHVILAFDNDKDGQEFTFKAGKKLIQARIPFKCANFLGKDIAEFFQNNGSLDALVKSAGSGYCWMARRFTQRYSQNGGNISCFNDLNIAQKNQLMADFRDFLFEIAPMSDASDIEKIVYQVSDFFPLDWLKTTKKAAMKGPDEMEYVERVLERYNIKYDDRTGFYIYDKKGVWKHITKNEINQIVVNIIGRKCTAQKMAAVTKLVMAKCQAEELITNLDKLPVFSLQNTTLHFDYEKGIIDRKDHSPNDFVTMQAKYHFIQGAKSKIFLNALKEIFDGNEDSILTLQEYFGYCLLNDCRFHKALFALGVGGNGKSVVTDVLRAMLGGINQEGRGIVSATMLSKLGKDFRTMVLKNSWVNISSETDIRLNGAEANFKIITSGEPIEDSYKGKDPVTFLSRTKLIVNCNEFPEFNDKSKGLARRILFLDFPINFVDEPREGTNERKLDPDIVRNIINNPEEMAGILNWALQGLGRILKNKGFTTTGSQKKLMKEYEHYTNPILNFIEDQDALLYDENGNGKEIHRTALYSEFKEWMTKNGEDTFSFSARKFYHLLENTYKAAGSFIQKFQEHGIGWMFRMGARIAA